VWEWEWEGNKRARAGGGEWGPGVSHTGSRAGVVWEGKSEAQAQAQASKLTVAVVCRPYRARRGLHRGLDRGSIGA
jgi:hypothetical protein